ncbi:MAG: hypothetical protein V4739_16670 [Pseudomonadota bacterium]
MKPLPLLSPFEVERVLLGQSITDRQPWATGDPAAVDGLLQGVCAAVTRLTRCESRVEWTHYGSGYASYVDAWFYRATPESGVKHAGRDVEAHTGLVVLLSRLAPYFVFMEGQKHWDALSAGSYLPHFDMLDRFDTPAVALLSQHVQRVLESHGLIRVLQAQLGAPLDEGVRVPTILTDDGFRQFDALFHWED